MNLYRLNLNLLIALDSLFSEQSVTLAANKLFITQAAMSNNLSQLRKLFNDELLVREKNQMILTNFAKDLQPKLHQVLQEIQVLVEGGQQFTPQTSQREFRLAMNDYMAGLFVPELLNCVQRSAPQIKITVISLSRVNIAGEERNYDLIIDKSSEMQPHAKKQPLFTDSGIILLNKQHPLAKKSQITVKDYLSYKHIAVRGDPYLQPITDQVLRKLGLQRDVTLSLPFVVSILKLIEQSPNLIATLVKSISELYKNNYQYVTKPLPFAMPAIEYYMGWHSRYENDLGHQWLREQLQIIGKKLADEYH